MSGLVIRERPGSRQRTLGDNPAGSLLYLVLGAATSGEAATAVMFEAPALWDGMVRQTIQLDPQEAGIWHADVAYGKRKPKGYGDWRYGFDTTGGTKHVTQSLETVHRYAIPGREPSDHKGAIGVTSDSIEGCDIVVPQFGFSISYFWDPAFVSPSYALLCRALTGKRNSEPFWGFGAGQVLFLGAVGSLEGNSEGTSPLEVQYKFSADEDRQGDQVGEMTITKEAWHYLWFEYEEQKDDSSKRIRKRPIHAYVERVYWDADFNLLGIGTG